VRVRELFRPSLDQQQSQAVIETVEGVQRVRGLAGSGKTIVLALKVAYLHAQNPDWKIAVTFNTRSLKDQFRRLINNFTIEQTGTEPDWEKIDILNAWGGPGDKEKDGIYHKFCRAHGIDFIDFGTAKSRFSDNKEFEGACIDALSKAKEDHVEYDMILIDEAQDFPPEFLRLCYQFLRSPKRLVYAYDELQTLTGNAVLPPEDLFGKDRNGEPLVKFLPPEASAPKQDIILEKCYRNSRPLLATAHALGFGIYRKEGLVQFFDQDNLWTDVGYSVVEGDLVGGAHVKLSRGPEVSPLYLENHSPLDDLIQFIKCDNSEEQTKWLVRSIKNDIEVEELRPEDIVVINPNPLTTVREVGPARQQLFSEGINNELAGVSTSRDVFSKAGSVTFTGIFRAKGNEAGMVYIINAHDCFSAYNKSYLALVRNRLFTAITRSKAWVRVLGFGNGMDGLISEWHALRAQEYQLSFTYPTAVEKQQLRLINKGLTHRQKTRQKRLNSQAKEVLAAIKRGELGEELLKEFQDLGDSTSIK
jgi:superfamily I DNA and RNA helicase